MKLVTFEFDHRARPGRLAGDDIVDLHALAPDVRTILENNLLGRAASAAGHSVPLKEVKLLAPIPNPGMVLSVGMNYHEHLKEMKTRFPRSRPRSRRASRASSGPTRRSAFPRATPTCSTGRASSAW